MTTSETGSAPRLEPAGPVPAPQPAPTVAAPLRWALPAFLLLATFFTTTTLGALWSLPTVELAARGELVPWLSATTVREVWSDPGLRRLGLQFSLPLLAILLAHEMGHWLACRRYRLPATLPWFLPAPFAFGTLGAFIRIRAPLLAKRQLFDVGVAGPLAGFAVLLPFLLLGAAWSQPVAVEELLGLEMPVPFLGGSLAFDGALRAFHPDLPATHSLELHPFALAAWVGLLATALNLVPLGQLDGGHLLYAVLGRRHRLVVPVVWLALLAAGLLLWRGWLVWALLTALIGLRHPPVADEATPLGGGRLAMAALALLVFAASLMPVPIVIGTLAP